MEKQSDDFEEVKHDVRDSDGSTPEQESIEVNPSKKNRKKDRSFVKVIEDEGNYEESSENVSQQLPIRNPPKKSFPQQNQLSGEIEEAESNEVVVRRKSSKKKNRNASKSKTAPQSSFITKQSVSARPNTNQAQRRANNPEAVTTNELTTERICENCGSLRNAARKQCDGCSFEHVNQEMIAQLTGFKEQISDQIASMIETQKQMLQMKRRPSTPSMNINSQKSSELIQNIHPIGGHGGAAAEDNDSSIVPKSRDNTQRLNKTHEKQSWMDEEIKQESFNRRQIPNKISLTPLSDNDGRNNVISGCVTDSRSPAPAREVHFTDQRETTKGRTDTGQGLSNIFSSHKKVQPELSMDGLGINDTPQESEEDPEKEFRQGMRKSHTQKDVKNGPQINLHQEPRQYANSMKKIDDRNEESQLSQSTKTPKTNIQSSALDQTEFDRFETTNLGTFNAELRQLQALQSNNKSMMKWINGDQPTSLRSSKFIPQKRPKLTTKESYLQQKPQHLLLTPSLTCAFIFYAFLFVIIMCFAIPLHYKATQVRSFSVDYTDLCDKQAEEAKAAGEPSSMCRIAFKPNNNIIEPKIYYQIDNFYSNYRAYVNSKSETQLKGQTLDLDDIQYDCGDEVDYVSDLFDNYNELDAFGAFKNRWPNDTLANPCGNIAKYTFSDQYKLFQASPNGNTISVNTREDQADQLQEAQSPNEILDQDDWNKAGALKIDDTGIAHVADLEYKFKKNKYGQTQWLDVRNEHFIVWNQMETLQGVYRLYGHLNFSFSKGQTYILEINNQYDSKAFNGRKIFHLTENNFMGGSNNFLGTMFLYTSVVVIIIILFMICLWAIKIRGKDEFYEPENAKW